MNSGPLTSTEKTHMKLARSLMILVLACSAFAADITGKWKALAQGPDGGEGMEIVFNFKVDGDKLTGTVDGPMGQTEISEGKVEGDTIAFTVATNDFKIVHKGKVSGDEIKMKVDIGDNTMEMTAKRVKS